MKLTKTTIKKTRLKEITKNLINYIKEELAEENPSQWFFDMFNITYNELKEIEKE